MRGSQIWSEFSSDDGNVVGENQKILLHDFRSIMLDIHVLCCQCFNVNSKYVLNIAVASKVNAALKLRTELNLTVALVMLGWVDCVWPEYSKV